MPKPAHTNSGQPAFSAASLLNPRGLVNAMSDPPDCSFTRSGMTEPLTDLYVSEMAAVFNQSDSRAGRNKPAESPSSQKRAGASPQARPASSTQVGTNGSQSVPPPRFEFTSAKAVDDDVTETPSGRVGQADLLEKAHAATSRAMPALKKQKTTHSEDASPRPQDQQGGVVGQWLQQQRNQAVSEIPSQQTPASKVDSSPIQSTAKKRNVVDLTAEEDDEVVEVLPEEEKEVCYGKLDGAKAHAHAIPHPKDHNGVTNDGRMWKLLPCTVSREPLSHNIINLRDPHGKIFASVDVRVARALAPLLDTKFLHLRIDARLDPRTFKEGDRIGKQISEYWPVTLNLYGPKKHATTVGKALSQKNVWLATPYGLRYGATIFNPHASDQAATRANWTKRVQSAGYGSNYVVRTNEEVAADISGIFNSLHNADEIQPLEPCDKVTTTLLDHQKRALRFMTGRETIEDGPTSKGIVPGNPLWRVRISGNGRKSYYHVITGNEQPYLPEPVLGGILADQMGLGKTLEAIAFLCSTLEEAEKWAQEPRDDQDEHEAKLDRVKSTLLICPKNVCSEWQDQIDTHLKAKSLTSYFYHGSDRIRDIKVLGGYDIIITTYSIVAHELRRNTNGRASIFASTCFFRVMLDEAHVIREQATQQSKAICSLAASRRWALTGTPIQNRLEDLGALIKFLRIKPFDDHSAFVQYIMTSFKMKDETALQKLHLLIDSFTLRRLKDKLDLPSRDEKQIVLKFNSDETRLHQWFARDASNKMRLMESKKRTLAGRSYQNVLRNILCLRLVSVHGRELLHEDDLQMIQGISSEQPIELEETAEEQPALTARAAYEMLMLMESADRQVCNRCSRMVRPPQHDDKEDDDEAASAKTAPFGYMLPCYDLVCTSCIGNVRQSVAETAVDGRFSCPFCESQQRVSFFALTPAGVEQAEADREQAKLNPKQAKMLGRYRGPHTKTRALLMHLADDARESAEALTRDESTPIKSVVFTEWTSHIDLLEIALEEHASGLGFVRFDGKMSVRQQAAALDKFRNDPNITVILVSIRAGGVGLNLTVASRVYVMEPQWNPAAEAQAVDRVHRLGQKRDVTIIHFIMADSIEETMVKLQGKKKRLADVSLNKNDRGKVAAENMEEFRELFSRHL